MRSGCREELCHYHRNASLCAFVLWIISIILLANTCDSSSWGISWIHSAIFLFFLARCSPPSNTHFRASPAFCIVLATMCVWMCAEFHSVRRHGLSCQWSSPKFLRSAAHWQVLFFTEAARSPPLPLIPGSGGQRLHPVKAAASSSQTDC